MKLAENANCGIDATLEISQISKFKSQNRKFVNFSQQKPKKHKSNKAGNGEGANQMANQESGLENGKAFSPPLLRTSFDAVDPFSAFPVTMEP
jgi:hypothetical protein